MARVASRAGWAENRERGLPPGSEFSSSEGQAPLVTAHVLARTLTFTGPRMTPGGRLRPIRVWLSGSVVSGRAGAWAPEGQIVLALGRSPGAPILGQQTLPHVQESPVAGRSAQSRRLENSRQKELWAGRTAAGTLLGSFQTQSVLGGA